MQITDLRALSTDELLMVRARHMANLNQLKNASSAWDEKTTARGESTMANLMQQVYDIDAELLMAGVKPRDAA